MTPPGPAEVAGFWRRVWRIMFRWHRMTRRPRYAPAAADDPEAMRRRRVSYVAERVIQVVGELPKDYIQDVLVEVGYLLNLTPDVSALERMIDGRRDEAH